MRRKGLDRDIREQLTAFAERRADWLRLDSEVMATEHPREQTAICTLYAEISETPPVPAGIFNPGTLLS